MSAISVGRMVHRELAALLRDGLIDAPTAARIAARYPTQRWDWHALGRWFLIFGAVSVAAGLVILVRDFFHFTYEKLAVGLALLMLGFFAGAQWLRRRSMPWTCRALELCGGFTLIGLTFTLGVIYSTGSGNWPALLLIDLVLLLGLSYALNNVLLLVLSAVVFFLWFGGFTGYASGWGAYWFGMNYPLRFLLAAVAITGIAVLHLGGEHGPLKAYRGFFKVWLSSGLFFGEMALWLLSLFGNFGDARHWHLAGSGELLLFNALWAALNAGLILLGSRLALRMATGYGATFLIIQIYTLYFAHVAPHADLALSLLIAGGSALALAFGLERRWRSREVHNQPDGRVADRTHEEEEP